MKERDLTSLPDECWERIIGTCKDSIPGDISMITKKDITPEVSLFCNGVHFTARQLEALRLIAGGLSLRGAAAHLGISAPTLFNYMGKLEEKCGLALLERGKGRSTLTPDAKYIVERYRRWNSAVRPREGIVVACTPLSEDFVREAIELAGAGSCREELSMTVGDDGTNLELGLRSMASVVIFDDPLFTYDLPAEETNTFDAGFDRLLFCDRGDDFVRLRWGAQRMAFQWLQVSGREFTIHRTFLSPGSLVGSGSSFFLEISQVRKHDFPREMFSSPEELVHAIVGVKFQQGRAVDSICENIRFAARKMGFR